MEFPFIIIQHIPFIIDIEITDEDLASELEGSDLILKVGNEYHDVSITDGKGSISYTPSGRTALTFSCDSFHFDKELTPVPLWMSILPPLIAILFALAFREVFSALFAGLLVGHHHTCISMQGATYSWPFSRGIFHCRHLPA